MGTAAAKADFDAIIVGAGFAGLYMLHQLRGRGFKARIFEAGTGVGGTWYWNRYPGARCDVESMQYSYQFSPELQQEWRWSERYAAQPEILTYANHVADRFDLRRDIQLETRVLKATFDEAANRWTLETSDGKTTNAQVCIMATGCLSSTNTPKFKGLDSFKGPTYHTGNWPHEKVDFTGRTVAMIGTGSSAIQSIPLIAAEAEHLTIFQRTANYAIPAHNKPLAPEIEVEWKANYPEYRARARSMPTGVLFDYSSDKALETPAEARDREYQRRWDRGGLSFLGAYMDLLVDDNANRTAAQFVAAKIRAAVQNPELAEKLVPKNIIGCKRLCIDTGYYDTFNRDNVTLIDVGEKPVECITPEGVRAHGKDYKADALILATGFDAMTGALLKIDIRGRAGRPLRDKWDGGPRTYLGLMTEGFPNLFTVTGPGSPSVLTNMLPTIEQHVEWIADCISHMRAKNINRIEANRDAEDAWVDHVNVVAGRSLRSMCSSWYVGANVPGKPRVFMPYIGGFPAYIEKCNDVVAKGYDGFTLS